MINVAPGGTTRAARRIRNVLSSALLILSLSGTASAQAPGGAAPVPPAVPGQPPALGKDAASVKDPPKVADVSPAKVRIGDRIKIKVPGLPENVKPRDLTLYLDGRALKGVTGEAIDKDGIVFYLRRTTDSRSALDGLLGSPESPEKTVAVSLGPADKQGYESDKTVRLVVFDTAWLVGALIGLVVTILLFVWLAKTSNIIRDSGPPRPPPGTRKPYSLARFQAAVWFFLVLGSFVFIYLITGDYGTITPQALILMGIGTGTALGAAMIDASKRSTADDQLAALTPKHDKLVAEIADLQPKIAALGAKQAAGTATAVELQELSTSRVELASKQAELTALANSIADANSALSKPVSEDFVTDLLSDVNGINFHRFQMLTWTVVLGGIFVLGVYRSLAMPEFDATLLALMGISAGTYLGFKIPERQN